MYLYFTIYAKSPTTEQKGILQKYFALHSTTKRPFLRVCSPSRLSFIIIFVIMITTTTTTLVYFLHRLTCWRKKKSSFDSKSDLTLSFVWCHRHHHYHHPLLSLFVHCSLKFSYIPFLLRHHYHHQFSWNWNGACNIIPITSWLVTWCVTYHHSYQSSPSVSGSACVPYEENLWSQLESATFSLLYFCILLPVQNPKESKVQGL